MRKLQSNIKRTIRQVSPKINKVKAVKMSMKTKKCGKCG